MYSEFTKYLDHCLYIYQSYYIQTFLIQVFFLPLQYFVYLFYLLGYDCFREKPVQLDENKHIKSRTFLGTL